MAEHLWTAFNEPRNIERPTDPVHQKIAYGKTSFQKEMFRKNMFCGIEQSEQKMEVPRKHLHFYKVVF